MATVYDDMPDRLGRYALVRRLGEGGIAEVFEGRMAAAAGVVKPVCVKRILPEYVSDPAFVRLFVSEARISMALAHGNVAQVFDFGHEGGDLYIVREFVDGTALLPVMRALDDSGLRFPVRLVVHLVRELLAGLHHAHTHVRRGGQVVPVVHGAISPVTILLAYEGQVKLVDFGLARAATQDPSRRTDESAAYMAPEQRVGGSVDPRTDVYGVGAVLYTLLCGEPPGGAPDSESGGAVVPPHVADPTVHRALSKAAMIALAPRPDSRWPDALAFQTALGQIAADLGPAVGESELGMLVRHAQADRLSKVGRQVDVPADYAKQLPRRAPVAGADGRRTTALVASGLVGLVGLIGMAIWAWGGGEAPSRSVEVLSRPVGARIILDGEDTGHRTNATLSNLPTDRPVHLTLELENHRRQERRVEPNETRIAVVLEPADDRRIRLPASERPTEAPVVARETIATEVGAGERWKVDLARTALALDRLEMHPVTLDPERDHRMTVQSRVIYDGARSMSTVFFVRRDAEGAAIDIGRATERLPGTMEAGTARADVFIVDSSARGVSGDMRVSVLDGPHRVAEVYLDPVAHLGRLNRLEAPVIRGLDSNRVYRVRYLAPEDGPPLFLVGTGLSLFVLTISRDDMMVQVRPGEEALIHHVDTVYLFHLTGEGIAIPEGQAIVEILPAPREP